MIKEKQIFLGEEMGAANYPNKILVVDSDKSIGKGLGGIKKNIRLKLMLHLIVRQQCIYSIRIFTLLF